MTNIELVLNMLAEVSTTAISKNEKPTVFMENVKDAKKGGNISNNARLDIENNLGKPVITALNAVDKKQLEVKAEIEPKKTGGKQ